eukprot:TRINITY_DN5515_c0_g1_i4.p1 TRINITY_DN5515_c0_g1~~TRINITY_DN5515_c0_g1_i4.p1  ORF type:complete len:158 (-),score=13.35 TRINITY_DN5515_c0_g1_i4:300-773(-)
MGVVICMIRAMGKEIHPLVNVAWLGFVSAIISLCGMLTIWTWHWPSPVEWALLISMGCVSFIGQYCKSRSLQLENAAIVSTVGYLQVAFSVFNDFIFYGNLPSYWSCGGVILICSWAVVSLMKNWFKDWDLFEYLRLKALGRSTKHQKLESLDLEMA